jgi:hypothetical protein
MRSELVVISWWSNCLGLAALYNLVAYTRNRRIYAVQTGKSEEQKKLFRQALPDGVEELPYDSRRPAEDWRARETVARELLAGREGIWLVDHDLFVQEDCEPWLEEMDGRLENSNACLCHPWPGRTITDPAFWLSPRRFPAGMPSFAPVPHREIPAARQPSAMRREAAALIPEKDSLVAAMEFLLARGMVYRYPRGAADRTPDGPPPFPDHEHLGGLYALAGEIRDPAWRGWLAEIALRLTAFFRSCPPELTAIEDPALLERLEQVRSQAAGGG